MTSGDIVEITFNHDDIGTGVVFPKAAEDGTFDPGGYRSNDDANMIAGNGEMIDQMNQVRWSVETTVAWDMNIDETLHKISQLASSAKQAVWTFTHINGTVYRGYGKPVGDIQGNSNAGTFTLKVSGGGALQKLV
jgi:hypothetical protein